MEKLNNPTANLKLTVKAICMYEKLSGNSFLDFDLNPSDSLMLAYCILVSHPENKITSTYQEILPVLSNDKVLEPIAMAIRKELEFSNQFVVKKEAAVSGEQKNEEKHKCISDIVPVLVSDCGLSIEYVMNEMNYNDIESFLEYRESKHQNELEEKRLFTWMMTSPHLDPKKSKGLTAEK